MEQQIPQSQILGFGSLKVFVFFPIPIAACRFFHNEKPTSDLTIANAAHLYGMSAEPVKLKEDDARAFIDWFLDISGERKVQPVGLTLV